MGQIEYKFVNKRQNQNGDLLTKAEFAVYEDDKPVIRIILDSCGTELGVDRIIIEPGYEHSQYKYALFRKILENFDDINAEFGITHNKLVNEFYDKSEVESYEKFCGMRENKALCRVTVMPKVSKK